MVSQRSYLSIGDVLSLLREEFPDVTISKIRFLEAEGLIRPARAESGYRRFGSADIERLRYILTAQRDEYLPLRVIRQRLDALDGVAAPEPETMGRSELLAAAGADEVLLAELEEYGILARTRQYGTGALSVLRSAVALHEYGIQPRHLRQVKAAASREVSLVEQVAAPLGRRNGSPDPALRAARDVAGHIARLHATLVEDGLGQAGLASGNPTPGGQADVPGEARSGGVAPRVARGLRSASGR